MGSFKENVDNTLLEVIVITSNNKSSKENNDAKHVYSAKEIVLDTR